jgi:hypothetical protein
MSELAIPRCRWSLGPEVEYLIANGAECEPLIHRDAELMKHFPEPGLGDRPGQPGIPAVLRILET